MYHTLNFRCTLRRKKNNYFLPPFRAVLPGEGMFYSIQRHAFNYRVAVPEVFSREIHLNYSPDINVRRQTGWPRRVRAQSFPPPFSISQRGFNDRKIRYAFCQYDYQIYGRAGARRAICQGENIIIIITSIRAEPGS